MASWDLATYYVDVSPGFSAPNPSAVWTNKDKKTGKTGWDELKALAADGWELVSVVPVNHGGGTTYLLYTFKRPK